MKVMVERAGFLTTVQDLGREAFRKSGVSVGGALDPVALKVANLLVGNEPGCAGLEVTLGNVRLQFADDRLIAWCGGEFKVRKGHAEISAGRTALLPAGERIHISPSAKGGRAWFAISGGVDVPLVLGSRSTDLRSEFGGYKGRALRDGDVLQLFQESESTARLRARLPASGMADWTAPREWISPAPRHPFLRILKGAHWSLFSEEVIEVFLNETFTAAPNSDRMGVRLHGPTLTHLNQTDLLSEAVVPGTLQVPPSGDPILLLGDCQTIGGYPKIAHVITVDLAAAAQLLPGEDVRFAEVSLSEAHELVMQRERDLKLFRLGLTLQKS